MKRRKLCNELCAEVDNVVDEVVVEDYTEDDCVAGDCQECCCSSYEGL